MGLCFRMGRAEAHLAEPREVTMPTQRARVSTRASLPNTLLVRSSSRHLGFPSPLMQGTHAPASVRLTAPLPDAIVGYGLTLFREPDHMHQYRGVGHDRISTRASPGCKDGGAIYRPTHRDVEITPERMPSILDKRHVVAAAQRWR